jgi:uncharacterized spore protein YtfJ
MSDLFQSIIEPLHRSAAVSSVFGEAVPAQGKTIIPVARIAYGFGAGGGHGVRDNKTGDGEGGGGGVVATPLGVYEITSDATRFVPLYEGRKLLAAALIGLAVGVLWARRDNN